MKSARICNACDQVDKQWDKLFDEVCTKYEDCYQRLQHTQLQLSIEKTKQLITKLPRTKADQILTKAQRKQYTVEETSTHVEVSTQTLTQTQQKIEGISQTNDNHTDASTQTITDQTTEVNVPEAPECLATQHDHSYADTQKKPFNCNYCAFKSARKYNRDKHELICIARPGLYNVNRFQIGDVPSLCRVCQCRVCDKLYSYDQLRKHHLQFIHTTKQRKNRNGHNGVSKETLELYLADLKASKRKNPNNEF